MAASLAACASDKVVTVKTIPVERSIPTQNAPRPLNIVSPKFMVITKDNIDQYRDKLLSGELVIVGMSQADFKVLLKNQAEYKRYIEQQKAIIVFYESNLIDPVPVPTPKGT
jgi:hypothetical protein